MAATILNIYYSDYSEYLFILIRGKLLHFFFKLFTVENSFNNFKLLFSIEKN